MAQILIPPGAPKTATAPITVTPAGLAYTAELFLGPNPNTKSVTTGPQPQTSTGAVQSVALPITMPSTPGSYNVYLDVLSGGIVLGSFIGTDTVVIPGVSIGAITWA